MAVRDRLQDLHQVAGRAHCGDTDTAAPPVPVPSAVAAHLETILNEVERIERWLEEIARGTDTIRRLHARPTFHTDASVHEEVEAVATLSAAAAAKVGGALRQLQGGGGAAGGLPARVCRLQAATLARRYQRLLQEHHHALQLLRDDRRALLRATAKLANLNVTEEECEALLDTDNVALFVDNLQAETAAAKLALRDLEARRDQLLRLERGLHELHQLFQQLAHLVDSQQEQLDTVEYYAMQASGHVGTGHTLLLKGTVSRRRARQKKLSIIICLASGVLLVLLVLIFT